MIAFVVPAYNEEQNILTLLEHIRILMTQRGLRYHVNVINDGSVDGTLEKVTSVKHKMPVDIYSHYPNKGVGESFRVGFRRALDICGDDDLIVTLEADNTSDLGIMDQLITKMKDGYDLVLASCYAQQGGVQGTTLFRLILSKGANLFLRFFFPISVSTYSSFYRVYRAKALREMRAHYGDRLIEEDGFECMVELLVKFARHPKRMRIAEVPMILDGRKREGRSKMKVLRTINGFLKVIIKQGILYRIISRPRLMRTF